LNQIQNSKFKIKNSTERCKSYYAQSLLYSPFCVPGVHGMPMKVDLSRIESESLGFDEKLSLSPDRLDEDQVAGEVEVRLVGTIRPMGDNFLVDGTFRASGPIACSRCLAPVPWRAEDRFSVEYRPGSAAPGEGEFVIEEDELDVAFLVGHELDLEDVAAEQVSLALPMRIVCDESCAGLCPRCGANQNVEGACQCEAEIDPRWQALQDISGSSSAN